MSQIALIVLFFVIQLITLACKHWPEPTRRYRTRRRPSDLAQAERQTRGRLSEKRKSILAKIAKRLDGDVDYNSATPSIMFFRHGIPFRAFVTNQHGVNSIRVLAHWPDKEFRLRIFPDQRRTRNWKKTQQLEDIEIGNDRFDEAFVIHGKNAKSIKSVLTDKVCKRIYSFVKKAHGRISITINGEEVEFGGKGTRLLGESQIVTIIKNFVDIYRLMLQSRVGVELKGTELTYIENRESTCMVCGEQVSESQSVTCQDCRTRHHRDCWSYVGKCSTYGCHSRRAS